MLSSQISYQIIRSSRKTMSLEIKADGSVVVRAPLRLSEAKIQKFVEEKQEWILKNLEKIGIKATFRNLEVNVFKNRLDNFDFDIAIITFPISRLPGNEQKEFWGSASAGVSGSFNLIGIKNPVVDELLDGMVAAQSKEDYQAYIRALDRVLLNEHYMIMQWYAPRKQVAYHNRFAHPETSLKVGFQPYTWWIKENE